jgi:hypothetical protein
MQAGLAWAMMAKTLFPFLLLLLLFGCNNYGMLDKLENPGRGNNSGESPSGPPQGPPPTYRIFVTAGNFQGDMGGTPMGITRADFNCQTDSANPDMSRT